MGPPPPPPPPQSAEEVAALELERTIQHVLRFRAQPRKCLGVKATAKAEEVRKRFLQLSKMVHPDKASHPEAMEAFRCVQAAYEQAIRQKSGSNKCDW